MHTNAAGHLESILETRAELLDEEKVLLYALVLGLKPKSCLEIGVFAGGSSSIILQALDDNKQGELYSIDPHPQVLGASAMRPGEAATFVNWHLIKGSSPEAIARTFHDLAAQPWDFVFIDGDHSYEAVRADIEGMIPFLADDAYLLFHDACNPAVDAAIASFAKYHVGFTDCGLLCRTPVYLEHMQANYYGLRLVRFTRR